MVQSRFCPQFNKRTKQEQLITIQFNNLINKEVLDRIEAFSIEMLKSDSVCKLHYHNIDHTLRVVENVEYIALKEGVSDEEMFILKAIAWLHDLGYSKKYKGHEDESILIAEDFLKKEKVHSSSIEKVTQGINATRVPQEPKSKLDTIISDADLFDLGTEEYFEVSEKLFAEWNGSTPPVDNRNNWLLSLQFLKDHRYFTEYGNSILEPRKQENIRLLELRLKIT